MRLRFIKCKIKVEWKLDEARILLLWLDPSWHSENDTARCLLILSKHAALFRLCFDAWLLFRLHALLYYSYWHLWYRRLIRSSWLIRCGWWRLCDFLWASQHFDRSRSSRFIFFPEIDSHFVHLLFSIVISLGFHLWVAKRQNCLEYLRLLALSEATMG